MTSPRPSPVQGPDGGGWALPALRIFFGLVYLTNGLAKVTGTGSFSLGPWRSFLINQESARAILQHDAATSIGPYRDLVLNLVLPHYGVIGRLLTVAEILVGIGLVTGVLGRAAALGGALLTLNVQIAALGAGEWTYEYLVELVPLLYLAAVPSGRLRVLDRVPWLGRRPSRWPRESRADTLPAP